MALTDNDGIGVTMPVTPWGNNCNNGGFFGGGCGDSWLGILFLIALCNGGFGGFGGFGGSYGAMMGMGMMDGWGLYPWLNNSQNINDGFRDQQLATQANGMQNAITSGFGDVQTALCGGFANVNTNLCNGFNGVTQSINGAQNALAQQMYTNQISDLERSFAAQTATTQGLNNLNNALQNCCCENRAATADVKYTIATEACANRAASTANTQAILDKLCQLELDGKNERIADLERQLTLANLTASQSAQTAALTADNAAQTQYIVNRVAPYPVPSYTVGNPYAGVNNCCGCGA